MEKRKEAILQLNELAQISKDAEEGFLLASEEVHSPLYQELFRTKSRERAVFASQIQKQIRRMGARPATGGTITGLLHRGWMNLRYQLNLHHDEVVLKECLRGEEAALSAYQDVLMDHTIPELEPMLEEQLLTVIDTRDRLRGVATEEKDVPRPGHSMLNL